MKSSFIGLIMALVVFSGTPGLAAGKVKEITSQSQFDQLLKSSGNRLLVVDFNAAWCRPCQMLSPLLERVAESNSKYADFYKVNVDKLRGLAARYHVRSIPYVVLIKKGQTVRTMLGLQAEAAYTRVVRQYSSIPKTTKPDGKVVDGVRIIKWEKGQTRKIVTVYLWEKIRLVLPSADETRILKIPELAVSASAKSGKELVLNMSARREGTFAMKLVHGQPAKNETLTKLRIISKPKRKQPEKK